MRPGPKGNPARVLRDAAIDYALEVEFDGDGWDKLRKAAIRYAESEKHKGRPRYEKERLPEQARCVPVEPRRR